MFHFRLQQFKKLSCKISRKFYISKRARMKNKLFYRGKPPQSPVAARVNQADVARACADTSGNTWLEEVIGDR
jgi:hypothetical protein